MADPNYPLQVSDVQAMRNSNNDPFKDFFDGIGQVSSPATGLGVQLQQGS